MSEEDWAAAKIRYEDFTDNHPTIHCNRFPSWSECSLQERREWLRTEPAKLIESEEPK